MHGEGSVQEDQLAALHKALNLRLPGGGLRLKEDLKEGLLHIGEPPRGVGEERGHDVVDNGRDVAAVDGTRAVVILAIRLVPAYVVCMMGGRERRE